MGIMLTLIIVLAIFVVVSEILHKEEEFDEEKFIINQYGENSTKHIEYKWDQLEKNGKKF